MAIDEKTRILDYNLFPSAISRVPEDINKVINTYYYSGDYPKHFLINFDVFKYVDPSVEGLITLVNTINDDYYQKLPLSLIIRGFSEDSTNSPSVDLWLYNPKATSLKYSVTDIRNTLKYTRVLTGFVSTFNLEGYEDLTLALDDNLPLIVNKILGEDCGSLVRFGEIHEGDVQIMYTGEKLVKMVGVVDISSEEKKSKIGYPRENLAIMLVLGTDEDSEKDKLDDSYIKNKWFEILDEIKVVRGNVEYVPKSENEEIE